MITIDCTGLENDRQLHELFAQALSFPDYYGHNLNALFDCLTDIRRDTVIVLKGWDALGDWKGEFEELFSVASQEDPHLQFIME